MLKLTRKDERFLCTGTIAGKTVTMLFDTGCGTSMLSPKVGAKGKLVAKVKCASASGILGKTLEVLALGPVDFSPFKSDTAEFIIEDHEYFNEINIDGVLGQNILFKNTLTLNFADDLVNTTESPILEGLPL